MSKSTKSVHFIAIGGAVMHNLALALHQKGYEVSGSDDEIYEPAKSRLEKAGILPKEYGWFPEKISADLDAIILGMHARKDNPELLRATELGLKVYSFPEYVFEQSQNKQRVVIAGSHGKTSITSIILHVLAFHKRNFDYLVGAQIEGFDLMVKLTNDAPVIIIEGDEYLSSAIEMRSKFLFYHPHIVLISGIAWDHFNVFPTFDLYVKAFEELADGIDKAGSLVFDETDDIVKVIGEKDRPDVNKMPYKAHPYTVKNGKVFLQIANGELPIEIFGEHNMKNLKGAQLILERLGITEEMFYEAIQNFKGASKRLETLGLNSNTHIFRDFAHAPSKVGATTHATKELYPTRKLVACYELHTFSSLNKEFLPHYDQKLNAADLAVVFFSPHTLEMKKMPALSVEDVKGFFGREDLQVFTDAEELKTFLKSQNWFHSNLLMMSSGTFGGMDFQSFADEILALPVEEVFPEIEITKDKKWTGILGSIKGKFKK
ncbi:peptidoglycan synthetase [Lacihabitans sp. LS3-19]|uniref:UDP-N-acetylmuramate--L-alanine ligase n=1 Tax=Lacihabitans sp. LS3-19 TaxID=2487335 RepID=UPI0020CCEA8F|nr:Mur ligase domain-containing protein [Lacihabitans sp. LS3-19]MCP9767709.1 peptidoglycan synthetase [Lacihabitans sp. LS3-19]